MPTWTLSAFADEAGPEIDTQIAALKRGGLSHIDLRNVGQHNIVNLPEDIARDVKAKLDDAGISVAMYGSPIGKFDIADDVQTDLDRLDHLARMRDIFGCDAVRMFSYYNKNNVPKTQWKQQAVDRVSQLKDHAGKLDLVLYHENESDIFGDHPDDVLALAELRDGKTFKLIYDFANYIRTGVAGWESWQMMRDITDCFHLKDQKRTGEHVPMASGSDTDSERILRDAAEMGWEGPCTLEPHLTHSAAVLATHATGTGDQSLKDMPPTESFQVAVDAAQAVLERVGVTVR